MADFNIDPPPLYPPLIVNAIRSAQYAPAPAASDFDANIAAAKAEAEHVESLRGWRMLAAQGHPGALAVVAHPQVQAKLGPSVPLAAFKPAPTPPPVTASVPQVPHAVAPAVPQPQASTPALTNLDRRIAMLQRLISPPAPPADLV